MEISKYSSGYGKTNIYQGLDYEEYHEEIANLKVSGKNLDSYERVSFAQITESYVSETYDKSKLRAIGDAGIPGAEKDFLFYATASLMKDFYSGEIDEDDVKKQIYEYVKQYTVGCLGKDDHSSNIEGIPESLKGQIKSAEAGTKLDDIGRMLLTVCDYKRLNKAIPKFDVSMELSGGSIYMN